MSRTMRKAAATLAVFPASLAVWGCEGETDGESHMETAIEAEDFRLRSDVETALPARAEDFQSNPGDDATRRAYADILYRLGNVWEADEVIAPLGDPSSSNAADLQLAARMAYLLGNYGHAETLYGRLMDLTDAGSEDHERARQGLFLTWYQTNRFAQARELPTPAEGEDESSLLAFMQAFEGEPYGIEWATDDRVAHLEMTNDITQPGALPMVDIDVNGQTVSLILDTGGDRLYLDKDIYASLGLNTLANRQARYAYTGGQTVEEPLGVAGTVRMGDVTLTNVPVIGATWKALGQTSDGVFTTQILKQFLSTMDYDNRRITLRERTPEALAEVMATFGDSPPVVAPFFMAGTHLMVAKGSLNGHEGINYFMDSGLAMSMPMIVVDETVELLGLETNAIEGTDYFWVSIESHGLNGLVKGATQAMGNVFVEEDFFWRSGFMLDALISHQYLWPLGSWTVDFDERVYYFPGG
ncbi:MAG: retropepsin-like aspartic protease [Gemmatimonadota bacterium]|nr:retropepsin-like aspartic protease [Gemmatimonadota bacterium]